MQSKYFNEVTYFYNFINLDIPMICCRCELYKLDFVCVSSALFEKVFILSFFFLLYICYFCTIRYSVRALCNRLFRGSKYFKMDENTNEYVWLHAFVADFYIFYFKRSELYCDMLQFNMAIFTGV